MKRMVSEFDCATGVQTEREMTDEELANLEVQIQKSLEDQKEQEAQAVAANAKLATTREKFLGMGLTQEEVDLIVPADQPIRLTELAVAE